MVARPEERYQDIREVIEDMEMWLRSMGRMPQMPEFLSTVNGEEDRDLLRFSYRVGDVKYSPYVKNYRFIPILFGRKQERSQNGRMSGHILSFYRVGDKMKAMILHEDCRKIRGQAEEVRPGDLFTYAGTEIEVLQIRTRKE
jgi:hypothetical protein